MSSKSADDDIWEDNLDDILEELGPPEGSVAGGSLAGASVASKASRASKASKASKSTTATEGKKKKGALSMGLESEPERVQTPAPAQISIEAPSAAASAPAVPMRYDGELLGLDAFESNIDFEKSQQAAREPDIFATVNFLMETEEEFFNMAEAVVRLKNKAQTKYQFMMNSGQISSFVALHAFAVRTKRETSDFAAALKAFSTNFLSHIHELHVSDRSSQEFVRSCQESLLTRYRALQSMVLSSSALADKMLAEAKRAGSQANKEVVELEQSRFMEDIPCPLDRISTGWGDMKEVQKLLVISNRAQAFVNAMTDLSLPVCVGAFNFVQAPAKHSNALIVTGYRFKKKELGAVLGFICQHRKLQRQLQQLTLTECTLTDSDCRSIAAAIKYFPCLKVLNLRSNMIGSKGLTAIATALWENGKKMALKVLNLDDNEIGHEGARSVGNCLRSCPHMETLTMSNNPIGDLGLFYILRCLLNPKRRAYRDLCRTARTEAELEPEPEFEYDDSKDEEYDIKAETAKVRQRLDEIEQRKALLAQQEEVLSRNDFESILGAETVATPSVVTTVTEIPVSAKIRHIRICLTIVGAILRLRNRGLPLGCLDVSRCGLTDLSAPLVALFAREHGSLTAWTLDHNQLSDMFVEIVCRQLPNSVVSNISMRNCLVTDEGCRLFANAANRCKYLEGFDLSHNDIGTVGAAWLASLARTFIIDHTRVGRHISTTELDAYSSVPLSAAVLKMARKKSDKFFKKQRKDRLLQEGDYSDSETEEGSEMARARAAEAKEEGEVPIDDDLISLASEYPIDTHDCMQTPLDDGRLMEWSILADFLADKRARGKALSVAAFRFLRERLIWEKQMRTVRKDGLIDLQAHYYGKDIGRSVNETMVDML